MRRNFHVRKLNPHDMAEVKDCERSLDGKPGLDPDMLAYPSTSILVAEDGKDKVYMPVQTVHMMETLGWHEDISDLDLARAMKQFVSILMWECDKSGFGELWFAGNNLNTNAFALNNSFEVVPYTMYRLRKATPARTNSEGSHEDNHED